MKERDRFIKAAKQSLADTRMRDYYHPGHLNLLRGWAVGICCRALLQVESVQKTGSGVRWRLICGHCLDAISLEEVPDLKPGGGYLSAGITKFGKIRFGMSVIGDPLSKEGGELSIVKLLAHNKKPYLVNFRNDLQDSPTDVIATGESGEREYFQVTKLQSSSFWNKLRHDKQIDFVIEDVEELVRNAIRRKMKYPLKSRSSISLVIDAQPGLTTETVAGLKKELAPLLVSSGFSEIWIVGGTALTHQIS